MTTQTCYSVNLDLLNNRTQFGILSDFQRVPHRTNSYNKSALLRTLDRIAANDSPPPIVLKNSCLIGALVADSISALSGRY